MKFRIVPKQDFGSGSGCWMPNAGTHGTGNYGFVKSGFIVTDGVCNVMPGAVWFRTVAQAMKAIRLYTDVNGDVDAFWRNYRK